LKKVLAVVLMIFLAGGCLAEPPNGPIIRNATTVSASINHVLVILEDGSLWTWGGPSVRDEQTGTWKIPKLSPSKVMDDVVSVSAGEHHSLAITADGTLWAWGRNSAGQIGDGTTEDRPSPVAIMERVVYAAIAPVRPNAHVGYGPRSFAITEDGTLWAWGANGSYDSDILTYLGDGTTEHRYSPVRIMDSIASVTPTLDGAFATTEDGSLWWWGESQLAPMKIDNPDEVPARRLRDFNYKIDDDGTLWTWGLNRIPHTRGELAPILGDGTMGPHELPVKIMDSVESVTALGDTVFVITKDSTLWGWGPNNIGQLGDGTTELRLSPVKIMESVVSIQTNCFYDHGQVGYMNTFALTADGILWAWGGYGFGAGLLGDGTTEHRLSPVPIIDRVRMER
jgi:alpha-tubulin suppressor-like RCC1 family protein